MRGFVRRRLRLGGFLLKADDAPIFVGFDDTELLGGFFGGKFDGGDGDIGAGIDVLLKHFGIIHFVDVVAGKNEDVLGALAADGIDVLVDGVGSALIPLLRDAHLRGKNFNKFAETHEGRPASTSMAAKAESFVLSENENATETGVDAIGKSDIDDAIETTERDGGLGAIASKRPEALALTTGKKYCEGIAHIRHEGNSGSSF